MLGVSSKLMRSPTLGFLGSTAGGVVTAAELATLGTGYKRAEKRSQPILESDIVYHASYLHWA